MATAAQTVTAPAGVTTYLVPAVPVNYDRTLEAAIRAGAPETGTSTDLWKVTAQYKPSGTGIVNRDVLLVNYENGLADSQTAVDYWDSQGYRPADPWELYAVPEKYPTIHRTLKRAYAYLVGLVKSSFEGLHRVPDVHVDDVYRIGGLSWFGPWWNSYYWFAFVRK